MKAVLAISGGIDSMVMLDILAELWAQDFIVATFNHGTRKSASDDVNFVAEFCQKHNLTFVTEKVELGENVSEETARKHRYDFLQKVSQKYQNVPIYTAHHLDDLVETIAINLLRGTGWRGLAVLDTPGIRRPFLESEIMPENLQSLVPLDKNAIRKYAAEHGVVFRQDPTNYEDNYLRNRVREKLQDFQQKQQLYELWQKQKQLKREIDKIVQRLLPALGEPWQRSWFENMEKSVAIELLRARTLRAGISATRPQLLRFLEAILTYAPGKCFNLPGDRLVKFTKTTFRL